MNRKTKNLIKYMIACSVRVISRTMYIFPVKKNRILFSAYDGKHICCNPKAIFEYMIAAYSGEFEYVWTLDNVDELAQYSKEKVLAVKMRSLKFYYMKATSKVCVCNAGSFPELPLRSNQFQINTHHGGGAYKTAGAAIKGANTHTNLQKLKWDAENTSVYLSSSKYFTDEVIRKQKCFSGEVYEYGMPRNDFLVKHAGGGLRQKVRKHYGIDENTRIVIYAPTYRDTGNQYQPIDIKNVIAALQERFGGNWVCLMRMHYLGNKKFDDMAVLLVTDYPDMQELLAASDVLISDYSSSIWDFSFTGRPCFLYTPDLDLYVEKRGLDTPIETWGFPVCKTNDALRDQIIHWDEAKFLEKMDAHHNNLGSCETGKAAEMISRRIYQECYGVRKR